MRATTLFIFVYTLITIGCQSAQKDPSKSGESARNKGNPVVFHPSPDHPPVVLGTDSGGREVHLGGFSGLMFLGRDNGNYLFLTMTDRGPNGAAKNEHRPFVVPDFNPVFIYLEANPRTGTYRITRTMPMSSPTGLPLLGLPPPGSNQEKGIDTNGVGLPSASDGIDPEGVAADGRGNLWVGEEYGPSLIRFNPQGRQAVRLTPGRGLPDALAKRKLNRGFEGIAVQSGKIYGFLQSALPGEKGHARIIEVDEGSLRTTREYDYPFSPGSDKIGDAYGLGDGEFLVLEIDSESGPKSKKAVYRIRLDDRNRRVEKTLYFDLAASGFPYQKAEGLALTDDGLIAVVNDNDFGVGESGPEPSLLFLYEP